MAEMEQATGKKPDAKLLVELLLMGGGKLNFSTFVKVFLFSEDPEDVKKREQEMIFKEIKNREEMYQKSLRAKRMREEILEEKKKKEEERIKDFVGQVREGSMYTILLYNVHKGEKKGVREPCLCR